METIVLVIHLFLALGLVIVVLMQRSEGGALGIGGGGGGGGGGMGGMFSARGAANALTRATAILAICFMTTNLMLAILSGGGRTGSILDSAPAASQGQEQAPAPANSQPLVPLSE